MPAQEAILSLLATSANEYRSLAVIWHLGLATLLVSLVVGWRPQTRAVGYLLAAPIISVSAVAWAAGNPFNGTTFAVLALLLIGIARTLPEEAVDIASRTVLLPGAGLVAFGSTYPHFLEANHWTAYVYAAPFGLLPCPTLSAVIGLTLALGLWRSQSWGLTLAIAGGIYGVIGVFALGVVLDYGLVAGALLLGITVAISRFAGRPRKHGSSRSTLPHATSTRPI